MKINRADLNRLVEGVLIAALHLKDDRGLLVCVRPDPKEVETEALVMLSTLASAETEKFITIGVIEEVW